MRENLDCRKNRANIFQKISLSIIKNILIFDEMP
jgi:hypothetical protein